MFIDLRESKQDIHGTPVGEGGGGGGGRIGFVTRNSRSLGDPVPTVVLLPPSRNGEPSIR